MHFLVYRAVLWKETNIHDSIEKAVIRYSTLCDKHVMTTRSMGQVAVVQGRDPTSPTSEGCLQQQFTSQVAYSLTLLQKDSSQSMEGDGVSWEDKANFQVSKS